MKLIHPSEFIVEELRARGWSWRELAERMGGDPDANELALDFYTVLGPDGENFVIGDMAEQLGAAFGCSAELFKNLDAAWRLSVGLDQ